MVGCQVSTLFIPRSQRREGQTPLDGPQNLLWPATLNLSLYMFKKHFSFKLINKLLKGLCLSLANIVPFGSIFLTISFFGRWCNPMLKTSKFNGVGEWWLLFPQFARCDSQTPSQATATQLLQKNCQKKMLYFPRTLGKQNPITFRCTLDALGYEIN